MTMIEAKPKKLRSGAWGVLALSDQVQDGDSVLVRTKGGKEWTATVDRVIWRGEGVAICSTRRGRRRGTWTGCRCGSREDEYGSLIPSANNCADCEFDEYD